ncbi:hypothetical protein ABIE45_003745 [Methylobacterium sp. OAE515]
MVMILQHRRHAKSHGDDVLGTEEHGASLCAVTKITDPGLPKPSQQLHRCGLPERHLSPNGHPVRCERLFYSYPAGSDEREYWRPAAPHRGRSTLPPGPALPSRSRQPSGPRGSTVRALAHTANSPRRCCRSQPSRSRISSSDRAASASADIMLSSWVVRVQVNWRPAVKKLLLGACALALSSFVVTQTTTPADARSRHMKSAKRTGSPITNNTGGRGSASSAAGGNAGQPSRGSRSTGSGGGSSSGGGG